MQLPNGCSYLWASITKATNILQDGFRLKVGDGKLTIWFDRWNSQGALSQLVDYVHISDTNLMLKDIIYDGFIHWNMLPTPIP